MIHFLYMLGNTSFNNSYGKICVSGCLDILKKVGWVGASPTWRTWGFLYSAPHSGWQWSTLLHGDSAGSSLFPCSPPTPIPSPGAVTWASFHSSRCWEALVSSSPKVLQGWFLPVIHYSVNIPSSGAYPLHHICQGAPPSVSQARARDQPRV